MLRGALQIYKILGQHQKIFVQPNVGLLAENWNTVSIVLAPKLAT